MAGHNDMVRTRGAESVLTLWQVQRCVLCATATCCYIFQWLTNYFDECPPLSAILAANYPSTTRQEKSSNECDYIFV